MYDLGSQYTGNCSWGQVKVQAVEGSLPIFGVWFPRFGARGAQLWFKARSTGTPHEGSNLAWKRLEFKRAASNSSSNILTAWCAPHRVDLVAKQVESLA